MQSTVSIEELKAAREQARQDASHWKGQVLRHESEVARLRGLQVEARTAEAGQARFWQGRCVEMEMEMEVATEVVMQARQDGEELRTELSAYVDFVSHAQPVELVSEHHSSLSPATSQSEELPASQFAIASEQPEMTASDYVLSGRKCPLDYVLSDINQSEYVPVQSEASSSACIVSELAASESEMSRSEYASVNAQPEAWDIYTPGESRRSPSELSPRDAWMRDCSGEGKHSIGLPVETGPLGEDVDQELVDSAQRMIGDDLESGLCGTCDGRTGAVRHPCDGCGFTVCGHCAFWEQWGPGARPTRWFCDRCFDENNHICREGVIERLADDERNLETVWIESGCTMSHDELDKMAGMVWGTRGLTCLDTVGDQMPWGVRVVYLSVPAFKLVLGMDVDMTEKPSMLRGGDGKLNPSWAISETLPLRGGAGALGLPMGPRIRMFRGESPALAFYGQVQDQRVSASEEALHSAVQGALAGTPPRWRAPSEVSSPGNEDPRVHLDFLQRAPPGLGEPGLGGVTWWNLGGLKG